MSTETISSEYIGIRPEEFDVDVDATTQENFEVEPDITTIENFSAEVEYYRGNICNGSIIIGAKDSDITILSPKTPNIIILSVKQ